MYATRDEWYGFSGRQPWWWAVLHAGKAIDNRPQRTHFRGPVILHASAGCTGSEYEREVDWMAKEGLVRRAGQVMPKGRKKRPDGFTIDTASLPIVPELADMPRGGFVGVTEIWGMVDPDILTPDPDEDPRVERVSLDAQGLTAEINLAPGTPGASLRHTWDRRWYMPERAGKAQWGYLLAGTRALPFVPYGGALGLFRVPAPIVEQLGLPAKPSLYERVAT